MAGRIRRHWKGLLASAVVLAVVLVVGVPFVYIHFVEGTQPAPLSLSDVAGTGSTGSTGSTGLTDPVAPSVESTVEDSGPGGTTAAAAGDTASATTGIAGTWTIGSGSQAGYRVHETLAGQKAVAVGRTDSVTGTVTITGTTMTAAEITVQVADIASDNGQRNSQFNGRIMDTAEYPTATFVLTKPVAFSTLPTTQAAVTVSATGKLTLHGTSKEVTFPISVQRTSAGLAATGSIDIAYQDYGIDNPSVGGFVSVGDSGTIEFLLVATRT